MIKASVNFTHNYTQNGLFDVKFNITSIEFEELNKAKVKEVERVYLTEDEIQTIINKEIKSERLSLVRDIYRWLIRKGGLIVVSCQQSSRHNSPNSSAHGSASDSMIRKADFVTFWGIY